MSELGRNTINALLETANKWSVNINNWLPNGLVLIDFKQLLQHILCCYLSDRSERCHVNGHLSRSRSVKYGVPQCTATGFFSITIFGQWLIKYVRR